MKFNRYVLIHTILMVFVTTANILAESPQPFRLTSEQDLNMEFRQDHATQGPGGLVFFVGHRLGMSSNYGPSPKGLYRFDRKKLEVTPLVSKEQYVTLCDQKQSQSISDLIFSAPLNRLIILRLTNKRGLGFIQDILSLEPETGKVDVIVADNQDNYHPALSPDGQKLAYFAQDPQVRPGISGKAILHGAGRVVDLATRKATTYVEPYLLNEELWLEAPLWLDSDRVLFNTHISDPQLLARHGSTERPAVSPYMTVCPYVALVNVKTGNVNKLYMPQGKSYIEVKIGKEKIYLTNGQRIVQTDWNMESQSEIAHAAQDEEFFAVKLQDGKLTYLAKKKAK